MTDQDYVSDHIDYLKDKARRFMPIAYIELTDLVDISMREQHVGWLFEKGKLFEMSAKACQQAVLYFDFYMAKKKHSLKAVELGRCAALFIAHMLDRNSELTPQQVFAMTENKYTIEEVFLVRNYLLAILQYKLDRCTASEIIWFLSERTHNKFAFQCKQAEMLVELCYRNYEVSLFGPVVIALAACAYAFEVVASASPRNELLEIGVYDFEVNFKDIERIAMLLRNY